MFTDICQVRNAHLVMIILQKVDVLMATTIQGMITALMMTINTMTTSTMPISTMTMRNLAKSIIRLDLY